MSIEYITMFKDYENKRHKGVRKFANVVENKLVCAVCVEKMPVESGNLKGLDIINTQAVWKLL
jgi:hypothetical protein